MCSGLMAWSPPTTSRMSARSLSCTLGLIEIWYNVNRSVLAVWRGKETPRHTASRMKKQETIIVLKSFQPQNLPSIAKLYSTAQHGN